MYFIDLARRDVERHSARLPDRDLAYFEEGAEHFDDYVEAGGWAQSYAARNRQAMMDLVLAALGRHVRQGLTREFSILRAWPGPAHEPHAALWKTLAAQFITYSTRNSVQSNGTSSNILDY